MNTITLDSPTYKAIDLAARLTGMTHGQVVARLVEQSQLPEQSESNGSRNNGVPVFADYAGHRTKALFDRVTHRIDIIDGPLSGQSFKSPSRAAVAVVAHYKPNVNPNRNGWSFWALDDGSGRFVQALRE